jgi:deoxyribodipyrimidine photolyase-related protein
MSDYCEGCRYSPKLRSGPGACPFNYLYWAFLIRHAATLEGNHRLAMPYRTLGKWDEARKAGIVAEADAFLDSLPTGYP